MAEDNPNKEEKTVVLYLRIPESLKEKITKRAAQKRRKINEEAMILIEIGLECLEKSLLPEP
ncbi:MAG: hypothetical protein QUS12_14445 [Methanosarcina sp.]|nr:hypothetical protein [Methanosarcina sp.]